MAKQNKGGRPSKIDTIDFAQVKKLATLGLTDEQMADVIGISLATFSNYKLKSEEFLDALKTGKEISDNRVVESLFKRATGYTHDAEEIFCAFGKVTRVKTVKHYPPDTVACIFWLKNRDKKNWRDKIEHGHGNTDDKPFKTLAIDPKKMTDDEINNWMVERKKDPES